MEHVASLRSGHPSPAKKTEICGKFREINSRAFSRFGRLSRAAHFPTRLGKTDSVLAVILAFKMSIKSLADAPLK